MTLHISVVTVDDETYNNAPVVGARCVAIGQTLHVRYRPHLRTDIKRPRGRRMYTSRRWSAVFGALVFTAVLPLSPSTRLASLCRS